MARVKKPKAQLKPTFLRHWRKHRKLTQEKASQALSIDATTLSRIERGISPYDQRLLEAASTLYRCAPQDLLSRDPGDPEGIWTAWDRLSPSQRLQAVKLLAALEDTSVDEKLIVSDNEQQRSKRTQRKKTHPRAA